MLDEGEGSCCHGGHQQIVRRQKQVCGSPSNLFFPSTFSSRFSTVAKDLVESAASEWPLDRHHLAYQLRLLFNRLSGRNKQYELVRGAQHSQPSGPESIMVHVGNAREQIAKLCRYEEDWCAMIQQHYPLTAEPPPVKMPAYTTDSHREYAKLWRVRHLRSWERGVAMPALLPELPDQVCFSHNFHMLSLSSSHRSGKCSVSTKGTLSRMVMALVDFH